jgi:hypothetical protein
VSLSRRLPSNESVELATLIHKLLLEFLERCQRDEVGIYRGFKSGDVGLLRENAIFVLRDLGQDIGYLPLRGKHFFFGGS